MGLYEFKSADAEDFARHVGIQAFKCGRELRFKKCPYCQERTNDKDTFAINLNTGQFKCLRATCGAHGNMITLSKDFNFDIGLASDYYNPSDKWRRFSQKKIESKPKAIEYLEGRGISEETTRRYHITTSKRNDNLMVFPFYDESGLLTYMKYRKIDFDKTKDKSKEWPEKNCKPILFGMQECSTEKSKSIIITEGQIDALSIAECGIPNAVSVPNGALNFRWIALCWNFLRRFDEIIVFGDHEKGKITLLEEVRRRLNDKCVKHPRVEDYKDCKDANDILRKYGKDAVRKAVSNAEIVESDYIKPVAAVKRKSYADVRHFVTRFKLLNRLVGGFYMGTLNIVTGERGYGKSTLVSQFGLDAIQQGYSCFFYSGELNDWQFQSWLEGNISGEDNMNEIRSKDGYYYWSVRKECEFHIVQWYKDKAFLYDNSVIEDDEHEELLKTVEAAITQYGCRIIFLDNLMTALADNLESDFYRQQSNFVKELKKMAVRFEVCIFLVAHPKKRQFIDWQNDDISGSGNITNLADTVLCYSIPSGKDVVDKEGNAIDGRDRTLLLLKNRISGRITNSRGIPMYFQESSKRISERPGEFDWEYGWEADYRRKQAEEEREHPEKSFEELGDGESTPFDDL